MDSAQPNTHPTEDTSDTDTPTPPHRPATNDDFLMPGPTSESNEGLARWGLSWLLFSLVLMLLILGMSFVCWLLATATGIG
jgi:hypothetical protein